MGSEEVTKVENLKRKRVGMRLNIKQVLFVSSLVLGLFVYNEIVVYRLVIWWNCSYPSLPGLVTNSILFCLLFTIEDRCE